MTRIAVIGAGIAGLVCARELADAGHGVRVFDKSRGLGGRMATRRTERGTWDHGAQYFTARDPAFRTAVEKWSAAGIVARYAGRIAAISAGRVVPVAAQPRYVGVPGMTAVARSLADGLDVASGVTVTSIERSNGAWRVAWDGGGESGYDAVVIAIPADQARSLLQPAPELARMADAARHAPCWAVLAEFAEAPDLGYDAAFVDGPLLGWVLRDASKPGRAPGNRWVLHATAEWSRRNLESAPADIAPQIVAAFEALAGQPLTVISATAHRWRYALSEGLGRGCLWDPEQRLGAAGDWCADGRIEGAFLSGRQLARAVAGAG